MALKTHTKSWIVAISDSISLLGLKLGIPVLIVSGLYLLWIVFGPRLAQIDKLPAADSSFLINSLAWSCKGLVIASTAVIISVMMRLFWDEIVGQTLSVVGVLLYFGTPEALARFVHIRNARSAEIALSIVDTFCIVGALCLIPGLVLVVRDCILRIW